MDKPAFHHEGAVAKDNARMHNGNVYDETRYHGGVHYHYHGRPDTGRTVATSIGTRTKRRNVDGAAPRASPFELLNEASLFSRALATCDRIVDAGQRAENFSKGRRHMFEAHLQGAIDELNSIVPWLTLSTSPIMPYDLDSLNMPNDASDELEWVRERAKQCAREAAALLSIANSQSSRFISIPHLVSRPRRHHCDEQKPLDALLQELANIMQQFQTKADEILGGAISQRNLAKMLQQIEKSATELERAVFSPFEEARAKLQIALRSDNLSNVSDAFYLMAKEGESLVRQKCVLDSLAFSEIHSRRQNVHDASHQATLNWIFADKQDTSKHPTTPNVRFREWLQQGQGIYWITGKAGSGKSTLMKLISDHPATRETLEEWAGRDRKLYIGSHFFWYQGTAMEKSYQGLLRSIIYDVLRQCPSLIEVVARSRWPLEISRGLKSSDTKEPWLTEELLDCLRQIVVNTTWQVESSLCFCFFIDGLDEYDGAHEDIVKLLQDLAHAENIKICASSRPWEIFQQSFQSSVEHDFALTLHLHTRKDMGKAIWHDICTVVPSKDTDAPQTKQALKEIVNDIAEKAEGVFLWVYLVMKKEILPGLRYKDDLAKLRARLKKLPPDLHDYYALISSRIDTTYRQDTGRLFLTCQHALEPLPMSTYNLVIASQPEQLACKIPVDPDFMWDEDTWRTVRARVNGRCQDLMAVEHFDSTRHPRIEFLHRSVKDFLNQSAIAKDLLSWAGSDFDVAATLFAATVFMIKTKGKIAEAQHVEKSDAVPLSIEALVQAARMKNAPLLKLVEQLDNAMTLICKRGVSGHWSNLVGCDALGATSNYISTPHGTADKRRPVSDDYYLELEHRDFLGHFIDAGLTSAVRSILQREPGRLLAKQGRPYLDYALRNMHFSLTGLSAEAAMLRRLQMVEMLLALGSKANDLAWPHAKRTIWEVYVDFVLSDYPMARDTQIAWALIHNGARRAGDFFTAEASSRTMEEIIAEVYGPEDARAMCAQIDKNSASWPTKEERGIVPNPAVKLGAMREQVDDSSVSSRSKSSWSWNKKRRK